MSDRPKIRIVKKGDKPPVSDIEEVKVPEQTFEQAPEPTANEIETSRTTPTPKRRFQKGYKEYQESLENNPEHGTNKEIEANTKQTQPNENQTISQPRTTVEYDDFAKPIPWLKIALIALASLALLAAIYFFVVPMFTDADEQINTPNNAESQEAAIADKNGFYIKEMLPEGSDKIEDILSESMSLRELLNLVNVASSDVNTLESQGNRYSIKRLRPGDKYTLAHAPENADEVRMIMIEPKAEPYSFYKLDVANSLTIEKLDKQVEIRESYIAAIVEGTLGQTFIDNNLNLKLISSIEEVLAWTIDLFEVGDGDRFKVLFDEEFVNGKSYRIDRVKALYFEKDGKPIYAYNYNDGQKGFFNEFGQSMKRSFLATPIKYGGVITSGYGLRVHPITGHEKAHLGTDFAAPEGTPIQAVADGTITIAQFKANNGNYVKIRHDKTYETQYLHMQKFADGIRPGAKVRQGDIIGYVGSTGLSSGPHVCYRFWKNKEQVDYAQENATSGTRIPTKKRDHYVNYIGALDEKLKEINYF